MRKWILLILGFLILQNVLFAEERDTKNKLRARFGAWALFDYNIHKITDYQLPINNGIEKIIDEDGIGFGYSVGTLLELPVTNDLIFGLRAGYHDRSGLFEYDVTQAFVINGIDSQVIVKNSFDANLANISIEPYLSYRLISDLYLNLGYHLGYIIKSGYEFSKFSTDTIATSLNMEKSGTIQNVNNFDGTFNLGLSYEFYLDKQKCFILSPEINVNMGLTEIVDESNWRIYSMRAGCSFKYSPLGVTRVAIEKVIFDTINIRTDNINDKYFKIGELRIDHYESKEGNKIFEVSEYRRTDTLFEQQIKVPISTNDMISKLDVYGKLPSGEMLQINSILARVQMSKEVYPVLPYVFFDDSSSKIPDRYMFMKMDDNFDLETYYPNPVKYHYNVLNIIADRMLKYPYSKIILTGYIDKHTEGNNCELAFDRVNEVKNYLIYNCRIDSSRIEIRNNPDNCYPINLNNADSPERYAENRRVEIECTNTKVMEPIVGDWYQRALMIAPNDFHFDVSGSSFDKINNWNFKFYQDRFSIMDIKGTEQQDTFHHILSDDESYFLRSDIPMTAEFLAFNNLGEFTSVKKEIRVLMDTSNVEVESLNLILFDVADYQMSDLIKEQIKSYVETLDETETLFITGYTDALGTEDMNYRLAKARAYQAAEYINELNSKINIVNVAGVAASKYPPGIISYKTPEERFFSRSVEIQIRKLRQ